MAVDAGAPSKRDGEKVAAVMAAQKAAKASPTAVEVGAPPKQNEEAMAAIMTAQKAAEASPTAVEAGPHHGQDGEKWMAIMAAQVHILAGQIMYQPACTLSLFYTLI